ncbi:bifunctional folylpolyglutamate synthase/dihydrofolate synthase [Reichenbachiella ulvae]|uniref:Dihydrofolate synthase/folylpolyglutamate synthase n=1 Tax=Reichenbachiella ulvae TaxID=2980104 RepID=A0ABT3CRK8_9BACT|nr:folylpolyglutamate synthase/dihydrofolate synthase family protein [Reichenbachiella ulvae]MCV9386149.1 bifunctional folylpolyglutamate synthase/dihydrofolate synthase [Reichenbachiella ulvae]
MTYQESLDFLYEQLPIFQRVGAAAMKKDLTNTLRLADALNNPERLFKSIHIAGTNGKGSTAHLFASVLQSAGYKVGLYTSPHLKSFRERIKINGELVPESYVVDFVQRCKGLMKEVQPSFFEITVIMAFEYFAQQELDVAVIEAGLGGRLDSTNIITPELSVITSIGLDHEDILGAGIENIAREKAGIIKEGVPAVLGEMPALAKEVIQEYAELKSAPCYYAFDFFQSQLLEKNEVRIHDRPSNSWTNYASDLRGASIEKNLPIVLKGLEVLRTGGYAITNDAIVRGVSSVVKQTGLKGRWQQIRETPLTLADIGHNEEAVGELMNRLNQLLTGDRQLHVVWGMAGDKAVDKVMKLLIKKASYYFCAADIPRAMKVSDLSVLGEKYDLDFETFDSVSEAYEAAQANAKPGDVVFVGGSTFVVAEIKDL